MEPLNAFGSLASAATNAPPGTQADSFGAIGTPFAYGPFSTFAPLKSPASNVRSGAPNHHSSPRALVLSRFPFFWHKFTVVNDDRCLRKSLPYLRNSVNWGYAFSQTRWSSWNRSQPQICARKSFFGTKIRIWPRIARSRLAPSKPRPCDRPEPPAPNLNRMAKAARFWPIDLSDRLEPSNPNQDARPRPRQSAQLVPKTPNQATQPNARPDRSLCSPDPLVRIAYRTRSLDPTLPSRIFRPGHAAWTESPSLAESNRLPGRAEPSSLHQKPGSNRLTLGYST